MSILTLDGGNILNTYEGGNPPEFEAGSGRAIKGLDQALTLSTTKSRGLANSFAIGWRKEKRNWSK